MAIFMLPIGIVELFCFDINFKQEICTLLFNSDACNNNHKRFTMSNINNDEPLKSPILE